MTYKVQGNVQGWGATDVSTEAKDDFLAEIDPLLSGREAAKMLGMSYPTFLRRVADETIPKPLKLGALSRWPQSEILVVIERAKHQRYQN